MWMLPAKMGGTDNEKDDAATRWGDRAAVNILKSIGAGARELIKIYSDTTGGGKLSKNVRQTNIMGFFGRKGRGIDMNKDRERYKGEIVREKKKKGKKLEKSKILRKGGIEVVPPIDGRVRWKFKDR